MPGAPPLAVPEWRREPHRRLFPLGAGLGVAAVLPFAFGGRGGGSLAIFHSVAQIQGFLTCFAVGFLFAFVPRRTATPPPAEWEMGAALALPAAAVACAWGNEPALASWLWLALLAVATAFAARRLRRGAPGRWPPILVWVPAAVVAGAAGAVLVAAPTWIAPGHALEAWAIGRGLLVQGFLTGLVLGFGGLLLPQVTRGEEPAGPGRSRAPVVLHALAAVVLLGSFPLEVLVSTRAGFGLRALVALGVLVFAARIHRPPALPGLLRRLVWLAAWLVPIGFAVGALGIRFRGAALHILFVGGFAQVALAFSTQVLVSEAPRPRRLAERPLVVRAMACFLAAAFGSRVLAALDLRHVATWLGVAAFAFCAAIAAWAALVGPFLFAGAPAEERPLPGGLAPGGRPRGESRRTAGSRLGEAGG
jgi:uncharacterized protein involved in response to NO